MDSSMLLWLVIGLGGFAALVTVFAFGKRNTATVPQISDADLEEVRDQVRQGRKVQAIKTYRQAAGVGLADAREAVDRIETDL